MRKHPSSYDDDCTPHRAAQPTERFRNFLLCFYTGAQAETCLCVQLYFVACVSARLICCYTVTTLPPCGTEAVIFVIALGVELPPPLLIFNLF